MGKEFQSWQQVVVENFNSGCALGQSFIWKDNYISLPFATVLSSISDFQIFALIILEVLHIMWEELFSGGFFKGSNFFVLGVSEGMEENKEGWPPL